VAEDEVAQGIAADVAEGLSIAATRGQSALSKPAGALMRLYVYGTVTGPPAGSNG
jgi:hypothetical protein